MKNMTETIKIYTAEDLRQFRDRVNGHDGAESDLNAVLMADIDISETDAEGKLISWKPIGSGMWYDADLFEYCCAFYDGHFDGNGHTISGLYIDKIESMEKSYDKIRNKGESDMAGLFGTIRGSVKNLTVQGCIRNITRQVTGGICAAFIPDKPEWSIENCTNMCNVSGAHATGGIAGYLNSEAHVKNCVNKGNITGPGRYTAGIVGYCDKDFQEDTYELVTGCVNTGDIHITEGVPAFDDIAANNFKYNQIAPSYCLGKNNKPTGKVIFPFQNTLAGMYLRYTEDTDIEHFKEILAHDPDTAHLNASRRTYLHLLCLKPRMHRPHRPDVSVANLIQLLATETNIDFAAEDNYGKTAADYTDDVSIKELIDTIAKEQAELKQEYEDDSFSTIGF